MLKNHSKCTGCNVCQVVCKYNAIESKIDTEGFRYPHVVKDKCVQCGICERFCIKQVERKKLKQVLCIQNKNKEVLLNASSGGGVSAIAEIIITKGGCVCAAKYNNINDEVGWYFIDEIENLNIVQGSKYFQIPMEKVVFEEIEERVKKQFVLFIGTPCQVDAINKIVNNDNLITIDLICGGVASYNLEKKYVDYWREKKKSNVEQHLFRKKVNGWTQDYYSFIKFEDGTEILRKGFSDLFNYAYNSGNCMRESCYNCEYTSMQRVGDFSIGDAWGIRQEDISEFDSKAGTSLLLINSHKAEQILGLMDNIWVNKSNQDIVKYNKPLHVSMKRKLIRNISYKILDLLPLNIAVSIINYRHTIKMILKRGKK